MTTPTLNRLALASIANNLLFLFLFRIGITASFYQDTHYAIFFDILWLPSLTALILLPTIIVLNLNVKELVFFKLPIFAITLSFLSVILFTMTNIN